MGFIFVIIWLVVAIGLRTSLVKWQKRQNQAWAMRVLEVIGIALFSLLATYLAIKVLYEEIYPCMFIDNYYCNFWGTQYWDLFGIEF